MRARTRYQKEASSTGIDGSSTLVSEVTLAKEASHALAGPDQILTFSLNYDNVGEGITQTGVGAGL